MQTSACVFTPTTLAFVPVTSSPVALFQTPKRVELFVVQSFTKPIFSTWNAPFPTWVSSSLINSHLNVTLLRRPSLCIPSTTPST